MIIVTGGTSGLGEKIVADLRIKGEDVFTISRKNIDSENHIQCDVGNYKQLKKAYSEISSKKISVSAVVNCAGIASMNLALTTPPEVSEKIIKTNLLGTIFSNQVFAPLLIKSKFGRIINFSTIAVSLGLQGESVYVASKAGVEAFSRVLAKELSSFNITVNCIAPGPIKTNLLKHVSQKQIQNIVNQQIQKKIMEASDVSDIVNLLLDPKSNKITGQVFHVGGF